MLACCRSRTINTPKNQHYVWQHYLEAWTTRGTIACYRQRDRKSFNPGTANIASQTYFYRTFDLTEAESAYLEATIASRPNLAMRESHRGFVAMFQTVARLREMVPPGDGDDRETVLQARALLDQAEKSLGESYHTAVENTGRPLLERLRRGDAGFWHDQDGARDFSYFLAVQYLRTARMKNAVGAAAAAFGIDIERVWPIESHFWATEIGAALFAGRDRYRPVLLSNETATPFITGDQPAINLNAAENPDMRIYYPVAPTLALVLTVDAAEHDRAVTGLEAEHLNHAIYAWSDDQIYGLDAAYLSSMASLTKSLLS